MNEELKNPVNIDGKDYQIEDLTQEQLKYINYIYDIDKKLFQHEADMEKMQLCRGACYGKLLESLSSEPE